MDQKELSSANIAQQYLDKLQILGRLTIC
jgi:hypothetical protein